MRRLSFRCSDDVTRRSLMHYAPPLDQRKPRHRAYEARPAREERCGWCLLAAISASAAAMALLVHFMPAILRGAAWVVVTLAMWGGMV